MVYLEESQKSEAAQLRLVELRRSLLELINDYHISLQENHKVPFLCIPTLDHVREVLTIPSPLSILHIKAELTLVLGALSQGPFTNSDKEKFLTFHIKRVLDEYADIVN